MKKLIIISDTHGAIGAVESLAPLVAENDYLVHLGDGAGDLRSFWRAYPDKIYQCAGNCDFHSPMPQEDVLEVESVRIFYCHGHTYGVKTDLESLAQAAKKHDCQIALYGHTHQALIEEIDGVTLINPGAFRRSIKEGGPYCYLVIHKDKATPVLVGEGY